MYCTKCGGFGFYTVKNPDGTTGAKRCEKQHGLLRQHLDSPEKPNLEQGSDSRILRLVVPGERS